MERRTWNRQVAFERGVAPAPELFAGERILGTVEAGLGDLGWLGYLLRRKERLVVTTHRLFQYSTNFMSANLKCLEMAKVEAIEVGSKFNFMQFVAGVILLLGAVLLVGGAISQRNEKLLFIVCSAVSALAGLFALMTSEKKVLQVSGNSPRNAIGLSLARLGVNESKSFVDLISGAVRNLSRATTATAHQASRTPEQTPKNSKTGDGIRSRASHSTQTSLHQSYQEPDEEPRESLNGKDKPYRGSWKQPEPAFSQPYQESSETPDTPSNDDDYLEYRTSPSGEGWYRNSSRERRMYIE